MDFNPVETMYFDPVETGKRIKAIRKVKGMTQMEFAEKLNISRSYMSKIEKGTKAVSIDLLVEIAVYCGSSLDYLVFGKSIAPEQIKKDILTARESLDILYQSL